LIKIKIGVCFYLLVKLNLENNEAMHLKFRVKLILLFQ
jgi:hypothetical protein